MSLIIVESPTKARTFNRILEGKNFFVFATLGHLRDLPGNKIGLNYQDSFKPTYVLNKKKEKIVTELKKLAQSHAEIILATDPDREGESIAYHVAFILGYVKEKWPNFAFSGKKGLKRIVFHEITETALKEALAKPEDLRINLIKAQQARRILDRIVGYELSPLLWKKMGKNWLSAGRVQTVALRLIVEREKEITAFKSDDYYQIYALFSNQAEIKSKLVSKEGVTYDQKFTLRFFAGNYQYSKTTIDRNNLQKIKSDLEIDSYSVKDVRESVQKRSPPTPYTTSLLQQDAFTRFGFSAKMTMRLAQALYEEGLITYHRTDSFSLANQFVSSAKKYIDDVFGSGYSLSTPRFYKTKSKLAQEAHEAIRPTGFNNEIKESATEETRAQTINHKKLYRLIFDRAIATQMVEASIKNIKITVLSSQGYEFESELQKVLFDGFLKVLNPTYVAANQSDLELKIGDKLSLRSNEIVESRTKPPPRYNEASLIRILEEKGIGRPSTYAPIISLIQDKNYVEKEDKSFIPTLLGSTISDYLSMAFPQIFDLTFTATMEDGLDQLAQGEKDMLLLLSDFNTPFRSRLKEKKEDKEVIDVEQQIDENCPKCQLKLVIRYSRFGKFIACTGFPNCKFTKPYLQIVTAKFCPQDKGKIVVRFTKSRRKFFGCENYPKCQFRAWKLNF